MMDSLNHPVAVIAIMAGVAVLVREITWALKNRNGHNPVQKAIDRQTEAFKGHFEREEHLLEKLTEKHDHTHMMIEKVYDKVNERRK